MRLAYRPDFKINLYLEELDKKNLYRSMKKVRSSGPYAIVNGCKVLNLCSNDYLGLSAHPQVILKAKSAIHQISSCSSRLVSGNDPVIERLEAKLAAHRGTEVALVYPTGYMANLGVITAIADRDTTIFSDSLNHASIIDACKLSGAKVVVFEHNNADDLNTKMDKDCNKSLVITEGVFSMDGDFCRIHEIVEIARKRNAMIILDDAHGDFVFGTRPHFSGTTAGLGDRIDIHISSLSKALGCFGGYAAVREEIREFLINKSRQFIFTSAIPSHLCTAAIQAMIVARMGKLQKRLYENIKFFSLKLKEGGLDTGTSNSQIIPIMVGKEKNALDFSTKLLHNGIFAQAIRYPTVPSGAARLRVSLTSLLTINQLEWASDTIIQIAKRLKII